MPKPSGPGIFMNATVYFWFLPGCALFYGVIVWLWDYIRELLGAI